MARGVAARAVAAGARGGVVRRLAVPVPERAARPGPGLSTGRPHAAESVRGGGQNVGVTKSGRGDREPAGRTGSTGSVRI